MPEVAAVASAKTVATVDVSYLQMLLEYNARRVSLQAIELFNQRMATYDLSPVDFSVLSLVKQIRHHVAPVVQHPQPAAAQPGWQNRPDGKA